MRDLPKVIQSETLIRTAENIVLIHFLSLVVVDVEVDVKVEEVDVEAKEECETK